MMNSEMLDHSLRTVPPDMRSLVNGESVDFCLKAKRGTLLVTSLVSLGFSLLWLCFTSVFVVAFFGPLFQGKEVHIEVNGQPVTASLDHLEPLLIPALIIGLFVLIGLVFLFFAILSFFKEGPWFIATPSRLIEATSREVNMHDWSQFSGSSRIRGSAQYGDVILELRTGKYVKRKNRSNQFHPDTIKLVGIPQPHVIERICRTRVNAQDEYREEEKESTSKIW